MIGRVQAQRDGDRTAARQGSGEAARRRGRAADRGVSTPAAGFGQAVTGASVDRC
jgi:hypothetical protein